MIYGEPETLSFNPPVNVVDVESLVSQGFFEFKVEDLMKELDTNWPWPLDAVQSWFENLYNTIVNIPRRVWGYFTEALRDALEWLWGHIAWPLWRHAYEVYAITITWTWDWPSPWKYVARVFLFPSAFIYKVLRDDILPAFDRTAQTIKQYFDGAVGDIFNAIRNAFSPIFDPLRLFADTVYKFLTEVMPGFIKSSLDFFASLPKQLTEALSSMAETIAKSASNAVSSLIETVNKLFTETVPSLAKDFISSMWEKFLETFQAVWEWLNTNVVPALRENVEKVWDNVSALLGSFARSVVEYYNRMIAYAERGDFMGIVVESMPLMAAGMSVAVAVDILSVKVAGTGIDPEAIRSYVLNFMQSVFDIRIFTSVFAAIAVQKPLEYAVRYQFRTEIPGPGDLMRFYAKNWIDYETFKAYMARHGYSDFWIDLYERSVWAEPRFDQVFLAYKRGVIPESDYRQWLNILNIFQAPRPGMKVPDHVVWEEFTYRVPSPFVLAYAADAGVLSVDEVKRILEFDLVHPRFVDVMARALFERAVRDDKALVRRYALDMYLEGTLTWPETVDILRNINISEEFLSTLERLLAVARDRRLRAKAISYLERAFLDGYISREDFIGQLTGYGVDRELAHRYAVLLDYIRSNYYIIKETKDERGKYAGLIEDMVAKGAMTVEEAYRELVSLGFTDAEIQLRLRKAQLAYENETRRIKLNDLIERVRQGLVDRRSFEDECVRIGYSVERCREWGEYYWRKYVGSDFLIVTRDERNALATTLTRLYVDGFMTEEELREELRRLGFLDIEIDLRIRKAEAEARYSMLKDLLAEADALLRRLEITPEEYVEYLVSLGMRRDRAEARARRILATVRKAR